MDSKSKRNYRSRVFMLIVVFTWILSFAFFVLQYSREKEYKVLVLNTQLQTYNRSLLHCISTDSVHDFSAVTTMVAADSMRVTIVDFTGNVLFDTDFADQPNHASRQEIKDAIENGTGYTIRRQSQTADLQYFYSATSGDGIVVRSALPYTSNLYQELQIDTVRVWVILVIAIVVTILAFFASRRLSKGVENLRDFAQAAENGEIMGYDTENFTDDELGEISRNIVELYKNLEQTTKERDESLKAAMYEEQEKIRIKNQLTNNINHEIKTPVHAIQACLETIVTNREKINKAAVLKLIEKAYDNVVRLCAMLRDISVITRISEASEQIKCSEVNINAIVDELTEEIEMLEPNKRMRLNVQLPEAVVVVGNESLIGSIFHNLMTNSLAYSGGRDIFIKLLEETEEHYKFEFSDNGVGVDEEHLPRLFERFYRVDSGRSRKMGGTGLGLSIVKNSVLFHHGEISVSNVRGGGLRFIFTLAKTTTNNDQV